jgi:hypothetical protein
MIKVKAKQQNTKGKRLQNSGQLTADFFLNEKLTQIRPQNLLTNRSINEVVMNL